MHQSILCLFIILSSINYAQSDHILIGTKNVPPFVIKNGTDVSGFSIDFIDLVFRNRNITYDLLFYENNNQIFDALQSGLVDIGHAAITKTSFRENIIDFSHSYFDTGFRILVKKDISIANTSSNFLVSFFTSFFWRSFGMGVFTVLLFTHIIWFTESFFSKDRFLFKYTYWAGIKEACWWVMQTLLQQKTEDPKNRISKIFATLIRISAVIMISFFTAATTVNMNNATFIGQINSVDDLPGHIVGTVNASFAHTYLKQRQTIDKIVYSTIDEAFNGIINEEVSAIVYDEPILISFLIKQQKLGNTIFQLVGALFKLQTYGIAFKQGPSLLKENINRYILDVIDSNEYNELYSKYFRFNNQIDDSIKVNLEVSINIIIFSLTGIVILFIVIVIIYKIRDTRLKSLSNDNSKISKSMKATVNDTNTEQEFREILDDRDMDKYVNDSALPLKIFQILRAMEMRQFKQLAHENPVIQQLLTPMLRYGNRHRNIITRSQTDPIPDNVSLDIEMDSKSI